MNIDVSPTTALGRIPWLDATGIDDPDTPHGIYRSELEGEPVLVYMAKFGQPNLMGHPAEPETPEHKLIQDAKKELREAGIEYPRVLGSMPPTRYWEMNG